MGILLEQISFSYGTKPVLDSVTCSFRPGAFHVILGPNGSGKTTLLDIISGFFCPNQGTVLIENTPIKNFSKREIARKIALVSQSYDVDFPFTVQEVVLMGRHPYISRFSQPSERDFALAKAAMTQTGISHLTHNLITELSGGEKQRCVLARALCQETPILLLDEAFSNLDINHTIQLMQRLKQLTRTAGKTVIAVLHDLNLASGWADTMLFLKDGQIVVQDETNTVFTASTIRNVFDVDVSVEFNPFTNASQAFFKAHHE